MTMERVSHVCRAAAAAAIALVLSFTGVAAPRASLRALLVEYRCPVVDRLERIYEYGDPTVEMDRFIAVNLEGHPHGYVQCMFVQNQTRMVCEAASGFYFDEPGKPRTFRLHQNAIDALASLGFSTDDSNGNFQHEFDVGPVPDFNAIADFILGALHDGYGARADSQLTFNVPFAPQPTSRCIPLS